MVFQHKGNFTRLHSWCKTVACYKNLRSHRICSAVWIARHCRLSLLALIVTCSDGYFVEL